MLSSTSFEALRDYLGSAEEGRDSHHIVGQHDGNVAKFGPRAIHNTEKSSASTMLPRTGR